MSSVFLEVVLIAAEAAVVGLESRDEIEEPLEDALSETGLGEVTGGGGGLGIYIIDVEVSWVSRFDEALALIRNTLKRLNVPRSTLIKRYGPDQHAYSVYD